MFFMLDTVLCHVHSKHTSISNQRNMVSACCADWKYGIDPCGVGPHVMTEEAHPDECDFKWW